ncbi:MAG: glycerophosphodiester phosphodiesterase family protein [Verrucomicrobiota bacterium]
MHALSAAARRVVLGSMALTFQVSLAVALSNMLAAAPAPEIVGHRGASADAPENTLTAFRLAYEQKADAAELDIHLTQDGRIVVMHDATTQRTGRRDGTIAGQTLAQVRELNVGDFEQWHGRGFDEKAPTLAEVLSLVPETKRLFIEIKCRSEILPALADALAGSKLAARQTPIITFDDEVARNAKARFPDHEVYWLHSWTKDKRTDQYPAIEDLIRKAKEAHLDGLDLHWQFPIDRDFVQKVHAAGLKLCTWTVDDPAVARAEAEAGVDGITTNRPGWLRQHMTP